MKKGKTCAADGVVAEMLQTGHQKLLEVMADLFTRILQGAGVLPNGLLTSKIIVLYKKGDAMLSENYRPISILP
eukprot:2608163-Pyramimonas_sp.AAC.1